jgi:hypothetical protein
MEDQTESQIPLYRGQRLQSLARLRRHIRQLQEALDAAKDNH